MRLLPPFIRGERRQRCVDFLLHHIRGTARFPIASCRTPVVAILTRSAATAQWCWPSSLPSSFSFVCLVFALFEALLLVQVQTVLVEFQNHEASWTRVGQILEQSGNPNTKVLALRILDECVKTRWRILPPDEREGIKSFLIALIIKLSSDDASLKGNHALLNRLNLSLVQILKQDWPHNWPNFISDLATASKQNESLCTNNMHILLLLRYRVLMVAPVFCNIRPPAWFSRCVFLQRGGL